MIDKKTRIEIVKLLIERRKKLGKKKVNVVDLLKDLKWIELKLGGILDEIFGK